MNMEKDSEMSNIQETAEPLYATLVRVRNTELAAYWTRYNIQAVINIGLLAVALSAKHDSLIKQSVFIWFVPIMGIVLSGVWLFFIVNSKNLVTKRWEKYIRRYERRFLDDNTALRPIKLFAQVKEKEKKKSWMCRKWDNLDLLAWTIPIVCMIAWGGVIWLAAC